MPAILARSFTPRPPAHRPAWGLPPPDGYVALTITGKICWPNTAAAFHLDATLMRGFPTKEIVTTTDWPGATRPQHFSGVSLIALLRAAGWRGDTIALHGADGYQTTMPLSELRSSGALIATELNGMPMQCTRYAPLWLIFDYDAAPDRITRWRKRTCSVWGLTRIEVL